MGATETGLLDRIVDILGPVMGAAMARTSVKVFMNEIKAKNGAFEAADLDHVVNRLRPGLNAFVGGDQAGLLIEDILRLKKARAVTSARRC